MAILITGGGTGGHLAIAKALGEACCELGERVVFVGSQNGQDRAWFENEALFFARFFLATKGVVNQRGFARLSSLKAQFLAFLEARKILKTHAISRVVSVGGYSAAPAAFAALSLGIPLFIHEQNAKSGTLNRLLKPFARAFFSSYEADSPITSYPVRDLFFECARIRDKVQNVLFLGGSQGSSAINDFALLIAPELKNRGISIAHQCGERDFERVSAMYQKLGIDAQVFAFDSMLHKRMAWADLAISRAGASSLWELSANALPTLFVPYPYAASDHQFYNAEFLVKKNLAFLVREESLNLELILRILEESQRERSEGLKALLEPNAAKAIAQFILK